MNEKISNINVQDPFYKAVKSVFDNWTAYQLAVSHSFAGAQTKEAAEWFLNSTYQWILENPDLEAYELEDFLADTMDQELHAELEDGSERQVASLLLKYSELNRTGKHSELAEQVQKTTKTTHHGASACVKANKDQETSSDEDADDDVDEAIEEEDNGVDKDKAKASVLSKEDEANFEKMEEGWTLITKSGKHLTKQ